MGRIVILKTGSTFPALAAAKGDFEDWILRAMGRPREAHEVFDAVRGEEPPAYEEIAGAVVTGSHANVTEHHPWRERLADWLRGAVREGVPLLGICYGHQLLACALGGEVADNPRGWEFGTTEVHLTREAGGDALLGGLETPLRLQASHTQSVIRLPEKARRLAWSARDENQAFAFGESAWGFQFHPEYDAETAREYIRYSRKPLLRQGQDPERLIAEIEDSGYGKLILRRFADLAGRRERGESKKRKIK